MSDLPNPYASPVAQPTSVSNEKTLVPPARVWPVGLKLILYASIAEILLGIAPNPSVALAGAFVRLFGEVLCLSRELNRLRFFAILAAVFFQFLAVIFGGIELLRPDSYTRLAMDLMGVDPVRQVRLSTELLSLAALGWFAWWTLSASGSRRALLTAGLSAILLTATACLASVAAVSYILTAGELPLQQIGRAFSFGVFAVMALGYAFLVATLWRLCYPTLPDR